MWGEWVKWFLKKTQVTPSRCDSSIEKILIACLRNISSERSSLWGLNTYEIVPHFLNVWDAEGVLFVLELEFNLCLLTKSSTEKTMKNHLVLLSEIQDCSSIGGSLLPYYHWVNGASWVSLNKLSSKLIEKAKNIKSLSKPRLLIWSFFFLVDIYMLSWYFNDLWILICMFYQFCGLVC